MSSQPDAERAYEQWLRASLGASSETALFDGTGQLPAFLAGWQTREPELASLTARLEDARALAVAQMNHALTITQPMVEAMQEELAEARAAVERLERERDDLRELLKDVHAHTPHGETDLWDRVHAVFDALGQRARGGGGE